MSEEKTITVKVFNPLTSGQNVEVNINPDNATVLDLTKKIAKQIGYQKNFRCLKLNYRGKILDKNHKDERLSSYDTDIKNKGEILVVVMFSVFSDNEFFSWEELEVDKTTVKKDNKEVTMNEKAKEIAVNIKIFQGPTFKVGLPANSTVYDLAKKIAQQVTSDATATKLPAKFNLIYNAKALAYDRDKLLSDLNIDNDTSIILGPVVEGDSNKTDNLGFVLSELETTHDAKGEKGENTNKQSGKQSSWPLLRIIIGVIDLLLLLGTIVTSALFFLPSLSLSIVWPIVLFGFFVVVAVILFAWSKILPENWLKKMNLKTDFPGTGTDKDEDKDKVKEETDREKDDIQDLGLLS